MVNAPARNRAHPGTLYLVGGKKDRLFLRPMGKRYQTIANGRADKCKGNTGPDRPAASHRGRCVLRLFRVRLQQGEKVLGTDGYQVDAKHFLQCT